MRYTILPKVLPLCLLLSVLVAPASAQTVQQIEGKAALGDSGAIIILHTDQGLQSVDLWGTDTPFDIESPSQISVREAINQLASSGPVRCLIKGSPTPNSLGQYASFKAQCLTAQETDIGLALIKSGVAVTDPRDLIGSDLAKTYRDAEQGARAEQAGLWSLPELTSGTPQKKQGDGGLLAVPPDMQWLISSVLLLVLITVLAGIGATILRALKEVVALQKYQISGAQKRERAAKEREKYVLAAALEGEITSNRAKLDAFLGIYHEMIKTLRDPSKTPKYKRGGDVVHEKPKLSRTVYDSNLDKLQSLGTALATDIPLLYNHIDAAPEYKKLEPDMPVEKVLESVDKIVRTAEKLADPMDKIAGALNVMLRDRKTGPN